MKELAGAFLKLGCLGFGGPIAALAMMEEDFCFKKKWLSQADFSEMYAVCKLLPGPVSTQMAISIGRFRKGVRGGIAAGLCFIFPSFLMILSLAYFYVKYAGLTGFAPLFSGMQAGALVVILFSTWRLARPYVRIPRAWSIAFVSAGLTLFFPRVEPLVIIIFGIYGAWRVGLKLKSKKRSSRNVFSVVAFAGAGAGFVKTSLLGQIFWVCFKAGAFLFGTGLAIVPLLEGDVVQHYQWLTHNEFMDALAMGQVTPGPIVIAATFIGYKAAGMAGALVATIGMFLPSFINVLVLVPTIWNRWKGSTSAEAFTSWALPAVIGGILAAFVRLSSTTLIGIFPLLIFVGGFLLSLRINIPVWILIPSSGILAFALSLVF